MEKILSSYSLSELVVIISTFALAFKAVITFYDWVYLKIKGFFDKTYKEQEEKNNIENRLDRGSQTMHELQKVQLDLSNEIKVLAEKVDMLIDSDKDDIKSFLTKEHHYYCYKQGWIDDYSLECCEKRFKHYKDEGGNSFIERFMQELRDLPRQPRQ